MQTYYAVASYQGNVYIRTVRSTDTTIYMDTILNSFDTEEEAKVYASSMEEAIFQEWQDDNTCPHCGGVFVCYCDEE